MKAEKGIMKSEKKEADLKAIEMELTSKKRAKTLKSKEEYICVLKKRSTNFTRT